MAPCMLQTLGPRTTRWIIQEAIPKLTGSSLISILDRVWPARPPRPSRTWRGLEDLLLHHDRPRRLLRPLLHYPLTITTTTGDHE